MDTLTEPVDAAGLTTLDRCDRCAAQAFVRAVLPSGGELLFCGHHAHEHRAGLAAAGAALQDETDRLLVPRESSAGI